MNKEELFLQKLQSIYPKDFKSIIATHKINKFKTFRVNRLKCEVSTVVEELDNLDIEIQKTTIPNAFVWTENRMQLSKIPLNIEGKIYIQNLSSMLAPIVLNPQAGENILDMCAAPGSKTSLIADMTQNKAHIYAVEKSRARFFKMKHILEKLGCTIEEFITVDAKFLPRIKPHFLNKVDKVLLDAPCTNEAGINLNEPTSLATWNIKKSKGLSKLQKGLLHTAYKLLKPGGDLVYSTCTYSIEENEGVIDWFLKKNCGAKLLDLELPIANVMDGFTSFNNKHFDKQLRKTKRIIPTDIFDAFFIAKIRKPKT